MVVIIVGLSIALPILFLVILKDDESPGTMPVFSLFFNIEENRHEYSFNGNPKWKNETHVTVPARWGATLDDNGVPIGTTHPVTEIGTRAFRNFTNLRSVNLHSNIRAIRDYAFAGCTSLEEIIIPPNVEIIEVGAFMNCTSLESVTFLGDQIKVIRQRTFENCRSLVTIELPASVYRLEAFAFNGCTALQEVTLLHPHVVQITHNSTFRGCININTFWVPGPSWTLAGEYERARDWRAFDPDAPNFSHPTGLDTFFWPI